MIFERVTRIGIDAATVKADINLDEHVHLLARARHRLRPLPRHHGMIDDERELGSIEQRKHAIRIRWIERIGEPDVLDAGISEHFRLAELRAADADRAAIDLAFRHEWALVCLAMRTQANAIRVRRVLHSFDVVKEPPAIDQDRGSPE